MTWARIDDELHAHRKFRVLHPEAISLWLMALSYATDNLTDGFISLGEVDQLRAIWGIPERAVEELCRGLVGEPGKNPLWERANGGFYIHDFADYNEESEEVLKDREEAKERMRRLRARRRGERSPEQGANNPPLFGDCSVTPDPVPDPVPYPNPESPGAEALAADAAFHSDYLSRYAQRLQEPKVNPGAICGAAYRELTGLQPDFKLMGKLAKMFGAMELVELELELFGANTPDTEDRAEDSQDYLARLVTQRLTERRGNDSQTDRRHRRPQGSRANPTPTISFTPPRSEPYPAPTVPELTREEEEAGEVKDDSRDPPRRFVSLGNDLRRRFRFRGRYGDEAAALTEFADRHGLTDAKVERLARHAEQIVGRDPSLRQFLSAMETARKIAT